MKKLLLSLALLLAVLLVLFSAGGRDRVDSRDSQRTLARDLGLDLTHAVTLEGMETHGGFHGDGTSFLALQFSEVPAFGEGWHPLPLDKVLTTLCYGVTTSSGASGPYIPEDLIPPVENGLYFFRDRHSQAEDPRDSSPVLKRHSQNFTLALYDTDTNLLYYIRHDT